MLYSFIVKRDMEDIFSEHEIITSSIGETQEFAQKILEGLHGENVIALFGDLGAGKTTFSQGIGKALGIARHLQSPTFTIVKVYDVTSHKDFKTLQHIDLYRLETPSQVKGIGITDLINDKESLVLIEWAEKMGSLLPKKRIEVHMEYIDDTKRKLIVKRINEDESN